MAQVITIRRKAVKSQLIFSCTDFRTAKNLPFTCLRSRHSESGMPISSGTTRHSESGMPISSGTTRHSESGMPTSSGTTRHSESGMPTSSGTTRHSEFRNGELFLDISHIFLHKIEIKHLKSIKKTV